MKNIEQTATRQIPQIPEVRKTENNKPVKVADTQNFEDRANNIQDKFTPSSDVPQLPTYGNIQIKLAPDIKIDPTQAEIILPKDKSYIDFAKIKTNFSGLPLNIDEANFQTSVAACDSLDEIVDILKWCNQLADKKLLTSFVSIIANYCSQEKIDNCRYLTDSLNLKIYPKGGTIKKGMETAAPFFKFKAGKLEAIRTYSPKLFKTLPQDLEYQRKYEGKLLIGAFAYVNNNVKIIDRHCRFVLDNADSALECTASNDPIYESIIAQLQGVVDILTPDFQTKFISKFRNHFVKIPPFAAGVSNLLMNNGAYELTAEILQGNVPEFDGKNDEHIAFINYNLAQALTRLDRLEEALPYIQKAYNNLPGDPDALINFCYVVNNLGRYDLFNEVRDKLEDGPLKNLMLISSNIECLKEEKWQQTLKGIAEKDIPAELHATLHILRFIIFQINKRLDNFGKIINPAIFKQELESFRARRNFDIDRTIAVCIIFDQELAARSILNEIDTGKNLTPILQCYKALLEASENKQLVHEIANYDIQEEQKADLHFSAASSCIAAENFESAREHLQAAIDAQPENEDYLQASFLTAVLSKDNDKIESSLNKLDVETKAEMFSTFTREAATTESTTQGTNGTSTTDGTDYLEVEFDHKKIHAHFQAIKAQQLSELSLFNKGSSGWKVGNTNISLTQVTFLGKHNGLKYYGCIADKFQGTENAAFKTALEKGFAKRAEGVNGVKAFKGVFEIKIDSDARLFTNKFYKNEQGQLLLYFDRSGNHDAVKLFAKDNKRIEIKA